MPTDIWKIPLDSNGAVRGSYYLRHYTEVSDTLGTVHFVQGRSVEPLTGQRLMHFVAALGADVDLEPADAEARAAMGVPEPDADTQVTETEETEADDEDEDAARDSAGSDDDGDGLDVIEDLEQLRALAAAEGVQVDSRWRNARLVKEIRAARDSAGSEDE